MEPGTRVFDTEDDDPDPATVVRTPGGETIADWTYEKDGKTVSTADENPDYPEDTQLVNITFEEHLEENWPEWTDAPSTDLWNETQERDISVYGFPKTRLGYIELPETLEPVVDQIADAVDELEWHPVKQHLRVEKMGETYTITPDRTVSGEGIYTDRLQEIAADQTEESTYKYQT